MGILLGLHGHAKSQQTYLRDKISEIVQLANGEVGAAILGLEDRDTLTVNREMHFPMQSVYKFHLAMAVLDQVDKGKFSADQQIHIDRKDLLPNTRSPLRDKYPNGNVDVSIRELLRYTVSQSDNNGCDILFKLLGGTQNVQNYIYSLGVKENAIVATEAEMHNEWDTQFKNWSTPLATVRLLDIFYQGKSFSKESYDFLWSIMVETTTGPRRLKGLLPLQATVAHKTGLSDTNDKGVTAATNDIGIVVLPSGKHYAIAVFVSNSSATIDIREAVIAKISKAAWDYFILKDSK